MPIFETTRIRNVHPAECCLCGNWMNRNSMIYIEKSGWVCTYCFEDTKKENKKNKNIKQCIEEMCKALYG